MVDVRDAKQTVVSGTALGVVGVRVQVTVEVYIFFTFLSIFY